MTEFSFFRGPFLVAGETRRTRVCCCTGYTIAALLSILREAKVALPTICQQRPRSPSLPLPSLIPFHPPSVHLSQHSSRPRVPRSPASSSRRGPHLAFVLHFIRPVRVQVFILLLLHSHTAEFFLVEARNVDFPAPQWLLCFGTGVRRLPEKMFPPSRSLWGCINKLFFPERAWLAEGGRYCPSQK